VGSQAATAPALMHNGTGSVFEQKTRPHAVSNVTWHAFPQRNN